jgi:hypothetical protein
MQCYRNEAGQCEVCVQYFKLVFVIIPSILFELFCSIFSNVYSMSVRYSIFPHSAGDNQAS